MRRWVLVMLALAGCDDAAPVEAAADMMPALVDQGPDARAVDMRVDTPVDARVAPDAFDMRGADAASDAAPTDAGQTDASQADAGQSDAAPDMMPAGCLATVIVDDFEIFQFEASRIDASPDSAGADAAGVCSRAGVLPWTDVDLEGARAACATLGFSVCTGAQWQQACVGPEMWPYPYGPGYVAGTCNDHVAGSGAIELCGARPACVGPTGIHDQNGNVWELTDDGQRRGASFKLTASMFRPEAGACESGFVVPDGFFGRDVGFRCCR